MNCIICQRPLKSAASEKRGYGPVCAEKIKLLELTDKEIKRLAAKCK